MKRRLLFAITAACWMLAGTTPAPAGYWNYGRKGSIGDNDASRLYDLLVVAN